MSGVSRMRDDKYYPDLLSGTEQSRYLYSHETGANAEQTSNNPIYGYIGGGETCWFNSALQMLLNTQNYREWIQTQIPNPNSADLPVKQKCFSLHTALNMIHQKEEYPFNTSEDANNRVIDIAEFIQYANIINGSKTIVFNARPSVFKHISAGQQDPFLLINDITDCINYGTYQQQYINIYHKKSDNTIEWMKPQSRSSYVRGITDLFDSADLPTRITNEENIIRMTAADALFRIKSNEFTSLQQLLDIIPKPLKMAGLSNK